MVCMPCHPLSRRRQPPGQFNPPSISVPQISVLKQNLDRYGRRVKLTRWFVKKPPHSTSYEVECSGTAIVGRNPPEHTTVKERKCYLRRYSIRIKICSTKLGTINVVVRANKGLFWGCSCSLSFVHMHSLINIIEVASLYGKEF